MRENVYVSKLKIVLLDFETKLNPIKPLIGEKKVKKCNKMKMSYLHHLIVT